MGESLYRFMSFESFVDTIQKKSLHFVHPKLFEDPYEFKLLEDMCLYEPQNRIDALYRFAAMIRFYVQSWTKVSESDAMWRIYNYNNFTVRIEIDRDTINLLEDVSAIDITYTDNPEVYMKDKISQHTIASYKEVAFKRKAFEHEKEVRLVKHTRWDNQQDAYEDTMLVGACIFKDKRCMENFYEIYKDLSDEEWYKKVRLLQEKDNIDFSCMSVKVDFSHIKDFIKSVIVSPFAEDWYVETVKTFCINNGIIFKGKSNLYQDL